MVVNKRNSKRKYENETSGQIKYLGNFLTEDGMSDTDALQRLSIVIINRNLFR